METLLLVFGLVFVAELGDKSQLLAMTFAARYGARRVALGLLLASMASQAVAVLAGGALGAVVQGRAVAAFAGLTFLAFAVITLVRRGDGPGIEAGSGNGSPSKAGVVSKVTGALTLAEVGDKTMLVTMALAAREGLTVTWLGAVSGMTAAGLLGVALGKSLGSRLPEWAVRAATAVTFLVVGVVVLLEALTTQ